MCLHSLSSPVCDVYSALCRVRLLKSSFFKRHISIDYLNGYNFSEAQMPRSLMMVVLDRNM
jgi:hypothetical protein